MGMSKNHDIDDSLSLMMNYVAKGWGRKLNKDLQTRGGDPDQNARLKKLADDLEDIEDRIKAEFYIHRGVA